MKRINCDLCIKAVPEREVRVIGMVINGDFCPSCAELVDKLYADIESLQERLRDEFVSGLRSVVSKFNTQNPEGMVPDFAWLPKT